MKKFLQRYKVLMVVVFLSLFFLPSAVQAEMFCFYFEGDDMSERCTEDGNIVVNCPPNYIKQTYFYYPINFVGAYEVVISENIIGKRCHSLPKYKGLFNEFDDKLDEPNDVLFWKFSQVRGDKVSKLWSDIIIKILEKDAKDSKCCVPQTLTNGKCHTPTVLNSVVSMPRSPEKYIVSLNKSLTDKLIGTDTTWDAYQCGDSKTQNFNFSGNTTEDDWDYWNISCYELAPINVKPIDLLSQKKGGYNGTEMLITSKYCEPKTNIKKPPAKKPPKKVEKLEAPSTLGDLNKTKEVDLPVLIGKGIKLLMQVIGTIALLMFVYGGLLWMVSAGNTEKTKKAMDIMLWAGLGVIVILSSYAIVNFVFSLVK
ncbi:MAG TPA: pilin [Candidatus Magasanikbacteria bacterium]|nr:pilin [Candidatus Magasanikbacteria bacterium]